MSNIPNELIEKYLGYNSIKNPGYCFIDNIFISEKTVDEVLQIVKNVIFDETNSHAFIKDNYLFDSYSLSKKLCKNYHITLNYTTGNTATNTEYKTVKENIILEQPIQISKDLNKGILKLQIGNVPNKIFISLILENNEKLLTFKSSTLPTLHISIAHFYFNADFSVDIETLLENANKKLDNLEPTVLNKVLDLISQMNKDLVENNGVEIDMITC
ncbi:hypothetical protein QEN19_001881 [Hanseniaspora menglaensis]